MTLAMKGVCNMPHTCPNCLDTSLKQAATAVKGRKAHLGAVEPEAAQAVEHFGLQEADPARVQLHDDREGGVGGEDDVVDHGGVVGHPDVVGPVHRPRPMIPAPKCTFHASTHYTCNDTLCAEDASGELLQRAVAMTSACGS